MPQISVNSHKIHFEIYGMGPALILLHGIFGQGKDWIREGYADIINNYQLITIDLLGHGKSSKVLDSKLYTPKSQSDDIVAVMNHLNLETGILWGYSYGARMACASAIYHPHRVEKLIMGGMHPYPVTEVHDKVRQRQEIIARGMDDWVDHLVERGIDLDEYTKSTLLANYNKALVAIDDSILNWTGFEQDLDNLQKTQIQQILYLGSKDRSYLPRAREYVDKTKNAEIKILDDLNHFSAFSDAKIVWSEIEPLVSA